MTKHFLLISAFALAAYAQAPTPVSVTPNAGSGPSQAFQIVYSDSHGYSAIQSSMIVMNGTVTFAGSCSLFFDAINKLLYVVNDAGTAWLAPAQLGQSATIQNSQCSVDVSKSWSSGLGTQLTLQITVSFNAAAYSGLKAIWVEAYENPADSGWVQLGSWTVSRGELRDVFYGAGPTYTLSAAVKSGTQERVYVDGLIVVPGVEYTIVGTTLRLLYSDYLGSTPVVQALYWPAN